MPATSRPFSQAPLGRRRVAAQHCAVQLPQCSMVALSIFEGMGGRGGRALQGALASGGYATKIFLYNKLPT
jgi:hypothetical protein